MEIKNIEKRENPLFDREEIEIVVEAEITPKNSEAEKLVSEKFSAPVENIKIKKIFGKFGSNKFKITANIYASKEDKEKIEPKTKKAKSSQQSFTQSSQENKSE